MSDMATAISERVITPVLLGVLPMTDRIFSALNRCMTTSAAEEDLNIYSIDILR
jgi:hypothetical protein